MVVELCQAQSIPEGESRSFELEQAALFAIKKREQIFVYLNRCPHMHVPLNWEPDKLLNNSGDLIQCSTHGALFEIENGECLQGPCLGQRLKSIDYEITEGMICISETELRGL
jgi:nitrite reductase/ring-hydroxylating ferredoxin subunit